MTGHEHHGRDHTDESHEAIRRVTTTALLREGVRNVRAHPEALVALVLSGALVAGIDWVTLHGAVPTTGYEGVQTGEITVAFGVVVQAFSRASVSPLTLVGLKPAWFAWAVGLQVAKVAVGAGGAVYALARLRNVEPTAAIAVRYAVVVAALTLFPWDVTFEGGSMIIGIPLIIAFTVVLVRLFALPGLLVDGLSITAALRRSWGRTAGHGLALFGTVLLVGLFNHLLTSVPVVGPVGSGVAAALHAGAVVVFLRRTSE
ncbi:hypothetical protein OB920_18260 [Halobacteria archaeon HArc-gm2]|nr:hypothetical protein [Halobacteria archaeon HArc-gm2]